MELNPKISQALENLTQQPGVYLMKDAGDVILYIGKAKRLKNRVSSYFRGYDLLPRKTAALVAKIDHFDIIITNTEQEALILEANLVKKHRPRYNIDLKDNKRYPSLAVDLREPYPVFCIVRKTGEKGVTYFGPFANAGAIRQSLNLINKTFRLRRCAAGKFKNRKRPCLNYQMGACLGPCCEVISQEEYRKLIDQALMFLRGQTNDLIKKVKHEMEDRAEHEDFEEAALLRDRMLALQKVVEKQVAVLGESRDRDVFGLVMRDNRAVAAVLRVRGGILYGSLQYRFDDVWQDEIGFLNELIKQIYGDDPELLPKEIFLPFKIENQGALEEWFSQLKGERVYISNPQKGDKKRLLEMAHKNAQDKLREWVQSENTAEVIMLKVQEALGMDHEPKRIECFDISNLGSTEIVASRVVFENGKAAKNAYRTYRIKSLDGPDDFASMTEVLQRRFAEKHKDEPLPDILMVDGGKGQLGMGVAVLDDLGLRDAITIIGIAKQNSLRGETEDKIFMPGRSNPLNLNRKKDVLLFFQRVRDEAHRFAITFHRKRRAKAAFTSDLDNIKGLGPKKRVQLLEHFGSLENIRTASLSDISALKGFNEALAQNILAALNT